MEDAFLSYEIFFNSAYANIYFIIIKLSLIFLEHLSFYHSKYSIKTIFQLPANFSSWFQMFFINGFSLILHSSHLKMIIYHIVQRLPNTVPNPINSTIAYPLVNANNLIIIPAKTVTKFIGNFTILWEEKQTRTLNFHNQWKLKSRLSFKI